MFYRLLSLLVIPLLAFTADARLPCNSDLSVRTVGGLVHGTVDGATPAVRQFLGIPYARPPVNDLRFAPPQPALPFGELHASEMPTSCMQSAITLTSVMTMDVLEFNIGGLNGTTGPIDEDCLTLSIWAPRSNVSLTAKTAGEGGLLPVLVWFYGGAFATGGVDVPYQLPAEWIQRTQGHVVVSFNHRGDIFGYPNAAGLPSDEQNVGLLDQRLALEWVRDNIAAFGGDPERIGAFGHSSGGCSIGYYSYAFKDDPIVNSLIMHSGNEFIDILTRDPTHGNFTFVASNVGCGGLGAEEELSCMRRVDAFTIQSFVKSYTDSGTSPILTFSPVVDDGTIFDDYLSLANTGEIARLPSLIGSTSQDGVVFVPYSPDGVDTEMADAITSSFFFCPTYLSARTRIAAKTGPVYRYLYSGNFTNISPRPWMGAWHAAELPMIFGTHPLYRGESTQLEYGTSRAMQDAWLTFVATAGTETTIQGWDAWDEVDGGRVVEFGNTVPARVIDATDMEKACVI